MLQAVLRCCCCTQTAPERANLSIKRQQELGYGKEQLPCVDQFSFDLCCCSMPSFLNRAVRSTGGCCIISARAALYAISDCKLAGKPGISRHMSATWAHSRRLRFRSVQGVRSKGCDMTTGKSNGSKQADSMQTTFTFSPRKYDKNQIQKRFI